MQWELHSSRIPGTRLEVPDTSVEQLISWESLGSVAPRVSARSFVFLMQCGKQKWFWALLVILLSFESYFVRELLAALFFFTVFYIFLVALAALYLLMDHVLYCGALWIASLGRSFYFLLHHHLMRPVGVPSLSKNRALDSAQELSHAQARAIKRSGQWFSFNTK